jgi:amidohydrolase
LIRARKGITALKQGVIDLRRRLHSKPEAGLQEFETSRTLREYFEKLGAEVRTDYFGQSVVVDIAGGEGGRCYAFRADMDALPVEERTGLEYASANKGMMHACGHDGHMAVLAGFGRYLLENRESLLHNVRLIFQPAEEGPGGALPLVKAGVLENPKVDGIFGLHLFPELEEGRVASRPGPMMAQTEEVYIDIFGESCHGAQPHKGKDAVVAAAHMIVAYQTIVSRSVNPMEHAVFTTGRVDAGDRLNVVAGAARIEGTMRTFREEDYVLVKDRIITITESIGQAFGCKTRVGFGNGLPAVINDRGLFEVIKAAAGEGNLDVLNPVMLAEDFSYYQREVPGAFFMLGTRNEKKGYVHPLHSCYFNFDEQVLLVGIEMFLRILERLGGLK